jgi:hypothetical protein
VILYKYNFCNLAGFIPAIYEKDELLLKRTRLYGNKVGFYNIDWKGREFLLEDWKKY